MGEQTGEMEIVGMNPAGLVEKEFWRNRRVFLTGHTGFKGAWLSLWLARMGASITGFSLPTPVSTPALFELAGADKDCVTITGDIRDLPAVEQAMRHAGPELIIHMAAQSLVRPSYDDPVGTYAANTMGTAHVLDAARRCPTVRAVLIVTSDKCYENREWLWGYREPDAMGGYDPYSSSKGCAELVTTAYRRSFFHPDRYGEHGVAVASARAGNVIGGGDWATDRLIPDAVRAFTGGTALQVRNPRAIRPWQHVLDPVSGYLQLAQQLLAPRAPEFADGWNFGPHSDSEIPVSDVLSVLTEAWGADAVWKDIGNADVPHEAHYLRLDCSRARSLLNWTPRFGLKQAVSMTAEWYRLHRAGGDLRTLTLQQIDAMMSASKA